MLVKAIYMYMYMCICPLHRVLSKEQQFLNCLPLGQDHEIIPCPLFALNTQSLLATTPKHYAYAYVSHNVFTLNILIQLVIFKAIICSQLSVTTVTLTLKEVAILFCDILNY